MGGTKTWLPAHTPGAKVGVTVRLRSRLRAVRVMDGPHPSHPHSHQLMRFKATKAQHQLPHQCHQCLTDWEVPGIYAVANGPAGNLENI